MDRVYTGRNLMNTTGTTLENNSHTVQGLNWKRTGAKVEGKHVHYRGYTWKESICSIGMKGEHVHDPQEP